MIAVNWDHGGGHILTLGGCGNGVYYLHDPETTSYKSLDYNDILHLYGKGKWTYSWHA
eukprot:NODE_6210_length_368_cov_106.934169_g5491_i0.p3 GENE.NODE_6210_length_368_cov_106.934169_g5491_i0~~NODE_6210_length_368_cov_106.934169_g5491_i0.p3  ORF type:complete len:58 (-),score=7.53 NODE_6210_length_368_cov_106.934169_g5491_i0:147-320(-)